MMAPTVMVASSISSETTSGGSEALIVAVSLAVLFALLALGILVHRHFSTPSTPAADAARGGSTVQNPT